MHLRDRYQFGRKGSAHLGILFLILLIAGTIWFFKSTKAPKFPEFDKNLINRQTKLPPASGVEFSIEKQLPYKQAEKYYLDNGHWSSR